MWSNSKDWQTGYVIKTGPTDSQLKIKNQIMAYVGPSEKILENKRKLCKQSTNKYDLIDSGVTMDLQEESFIESCPHLLKITLWKEFACLVQNYRIAI